MMVMKSGHTSAHGQPIVGTTQGWEFWVPKLGGVNGRHSQKLIDAGKTGNRWFAGIHTQHYPGPKLMEGLFKTNLAWTGFYLGPAPSYSHGGWMRSLPTLKSIGWGVVPIYLGRQWYHPGRLIDVVNHPPEELGAKDGYHAANLALAAGFITSVTIVYLDIELAPPPDPARAQMMVDYWRSWAKALKEYGYLPGVYCSPLFASALMHADIPPSRVWAAYFPPTGFVGLIGNPFPLLDPKKCLVYHNAVAWHWASNRKIVGPERRILESRYDLDSSEMPDPSSILKRELQ
jgi:hypothetical protein